MDLSHPLDLNDEFGLFDYGDNFLSEEYSNLLHTPTPFETLDLPSAEASPVETKQAQPPNSPLETFSVSGQDLLGFSNVPHTRQTILDTSGDPATVNVAAQLTGMFFVAESDVHSQAGKMLESPELTCYRRNLFKVNGTIFVSRGIKYVQMEGNMRDEIINITAELSAIESAEGDSVKIISVPYKNSASNGNSSTGDAPMPIDLDIGRNINRYSDPCPFPVSWERLQFRNATAKNSRRTSSQQHYKLIISLIATLSSGTKVVLCKSSSVAIIVRGRSPGSFLPKKETPLVKSSRTPQQWPGKASSSSKSQAREAANSQKAAPTQEPPKVPDNFNNSLADQVLYPLDFWSSQTEALTDSAPLMEEDDLEIAPEPRTMSASEKLNSRDTSLRRGDSFDRIKSEKDIAVDKPASVILQSTTRSPDTVSTGSGVLYEYFPLSIDDWTVPVEAVYRPHGVHHKKPRESDTQPRMKRRYFMEFVQ